MEQILHDRKDAKGEQNLPSELSSIECDICKEKITHRATFYQSGIHSRVICEICYKRFPKNDIELMINLFNAYGGYFGKYKKLKSSVFKKLKELNQADINKDEITSADDVNLQLLHAALLFGFSPQEYFQGISYIN
ncbi:MAG: hypothetical protein ACFFDX_14785 [Candidatus Odinarchaeota archaeon]